MLQTISACPVCVTVNFGCIYKYLYTVLRTVMHTVGVVFHNVPGQPEPPTVTRRTRHEAELTFHPPDYSGSAIQWYIVEMKAKSEPMWIVVGRHHTYSAQRSAKKLEYVATGLHKKSEYTFRVTAVNAAGSGEPSEPSIPSKYGEFA